MVARWRVAATFVCGLMLACGCSRGPESAKPETAAASSRSNSVAGTRSGEAPRGFAADAIVAADYSDAMDRLTKVEADGDLPQPPDDDATLDELRRFGAAWQERWGPSFEVSLDGGRPLLQRGSPAPPWTVRTLDGEPASRDEYAGRHVLMVWGSLSCPTTCFRVPALEELARKWADAGLACVFVYEREAHVGGRFGYGVIQQAFVLDDRVRHARRLAAMFGLRQTILIDDMSNQTKQAYAAQDNSAYLIDADGRIVVSQVFFEPTEIEHELAVQFGPRESASAGGEKRRDEKSPEPEEQ